MIATMKMRRILLVLFCAFGLCACNRSAESPKLYNPGIEPLTADELASLLGMYHWKITQTPNDGKPYWGVRIVVANHGSTYLPVNPPPAPYKMLGAPAILSFDSPVASDGNPQILLGMRSENGGFTGTLSATTPGKGTTTTRFQIRRQEIPTKDKDGDQMGACSGTVWKDNRVDLFDYRDSNGQPVAAICLEFLHSAPP